MAGRAVLLSFAAVSLYLLAPSLIAVFSTAPQLERIEPLWFAPMLVFEAASLASMAVVQHVCLQTKRFLPVLSSGLAGTALAYVVPGGGAAGAALQYSMLVSTGQVAGAHVASALAGANLLAFATLLALPVLTLPAILAGLPVADGLLRAAFLGLGGFALMALTGAMLLALDRPMVRLGNLIQQVHNGILPRKPPWRDVSTRLVRERDVVLRAVGDRWWQALLAAVGRWVLDYAVLLTALAAVGAKPSPSLVLLAYVGAQVLAQIPITPGGLGFVEAGLTGLLALAGVGAAEAALATLAYRLVSYWLPLPAGGIAGYLHRRRPASSLG